MRSTLPLTGKCHFCGKPTPNRFCCRDHNAMYHVYLRRGRKYGEKRQKAAPKLKLTLEDRINAIVERAMREQTLGWATVAP